MLQNGPLKVAVMFTGELAPTIVKFPSRSVTTLPAEEDREMYGTGIGVSLGTVSLEPLPAVARASMRPVTSRR